uniref:Leucoanthocyanidin reductase n=1 Tax=Desmodium uncinatum TaxID=225101 RepID=LAR_DESUN|nr:RecName: Full=Leucoanthocyanidin reductase; Short=Leucocyanidin reductase [Desmodium uncinatum]CAD79341.1 leucoanthocyanidin reductase [Desmodium uncinatum]
MTVSGAIPSMTKNRTLVVGGTGFIGQFITKASLGFGYPTFLLVRPGPVSPSKAVIIKTFQDKGAKVIYGVINDKECMEKILKEYEIDVVISLVGGARLLDQLTLLEAIKSVKTIKRFLPSEFGHDVDRTDPVEPGLTMYKEKRLVRRAVEEYGIPFTNICCNSIASWPYYDNCHPSQVPPPMDQFQIYGDGNTKAYFIDGNDIGKFTMKTIDDIRTLNKNVHFRPSSNCYSINELASLWEKKIGRTLPRFTVTADKLLAHAAENIIPESIVSSFTHDIFINGCQVNFSIDEHSDVEIDTLYPDEKFRSLDDCYEDFVPMVHDKIHAGKSGEIKIKDGKPLVQTGTIEEINKDIKTLVETQPNEEIKKDMKALVEAVPISAMG